MGAHRELLPAPWREPVAGRTRGGSAGGVPTKLQVQGGERTRSLGVGGRTGASERAGRQAGPVWN